MKTLLLMLFVLSTTIIYQDPYTGYGYIIENTPRGNSFVQIIGEPPIYITN